MAQILKQLLLIQTLGYLILGCLTWSIKITVLRSKSLTLRSCATSIQINLLTFGICPHWWYLEKTLDLSGSNVNLPKNGPCWPKNVFVCTVFKRNQLHNIKFCPLSFWELLKWNKLLHEALFLVNKKNTSFSQKSLE